MKPILIVAVLYVVTLLCSCQKELTPFTDTPGTDSTSTDSSYLPLTASTYWIYMDSASALYDTSTVLDQDTVINGVASFKVYTTGEAGQDYSYYGISNHNYYLTGSQNGVVVTLLILNDTTSVGNGWIDDMGTVNGVPSKGTGTIIEKLNTYTVQGETYSNVIHSHYVLSYNLTGTFADFVEYDFYFAKGKGIIKGEYVLRDVLGTGTGDIVGSKDLFDYSIK